MRRRIGLAIVAVSITAVLLTGIGTIAFSHHQARESAEEQIRSEAAALAPFLSRDTPGDGRVGDVLRARHIQQFRRALRLVDASAVVLDRSGAITKGTLPENVPQNAVTQARAANGEASGLNGRLVWAVVLSESMPNGRQVAVVLTRDVPLVSGAVPWVVLSGLVALGLAIVAAGIVARRIAEPIAALDGVTNQIAAGDFSVRADVSSRDDETARLARSIDAMAESLGNTQRTQREFLLSVSHDLRTPLTSMRGYADAIVDDVATDPKEAARVIVAESQRLERLIQDLLDLARADASGLSLHSAPVDLYELALAAATSFQPAASKQKVTLAFAGKQEAIMVWADTDRLAQVLANIIENALKFARSRVEVTVATEINAAVVCVSDDGPGIEPDELERVFDRFYQARRVTQDAVKRSAGSGLGLTISRELIVAMGGEIRARSLDEGGTVFEVCLPLRADLPPTR